MKIYKSELNAFIGELEIYADETGILRIDFNGRGKGKEGPLEENEWTKKAVIQLEEYFTGQRKKFDLPLNLHGTDFQKKVWNGLLEIPYGETTTYGKLAHAIGDDKAARAVGMALHNNPIMIVVPCHRVIGANGSLTGFAGGLKVKEKLLSLEV